MDEFMYGQIDLIEPLRSCVILYTFQVRFPNVNQGVQCDQKWKSRARYEVILADSRREGSRLWII